MTSINTNGTAMAAIRSLSQINSDMGKTQARIESGLRINQASNDPAVFAISQGMRADLKGLDAVKDSLNFGTATLKVAQSAATKISNELATLKQTVTQGQQQGLDKATIDAQIENALNNINAFTRTATFNGVNLLVNPADNAAYGVSDNSLTVVSDILGNTQSTSGANSSAQGLGLDGLTWDQAGLEIAFDDTMAFANGDFVNLTQANGRQVIFEFVDGATALTQTPVEDDPTTATTATGGNEEVKVVAVVYDAAAESPTVGLQKLMDAMRAEGFGVSLGRSGEAGTEGQTAVTVTGGLDVAASVAATTIAAGATAQQVGGTDTAIAAVDSAIDTIGSTLATLGASIRQLESLSEFNKQLTDSVKEGLGALVDADLAEESARLTSLQTKQQLAVQSLSIANQQGQSLLGLFR
ncbi:flagellin [Elioraea rosea]|uniref:flagellin n=1 Tax=Elioraea rosea TaxID=2492390 RepID=UPI00118525C4|nr:flagellin [Elioraea rosea]